jgi:hypothetical protein
MKALRAALLIALILLPACESTYKKETIRESVRELAKKEYDLDIDVAVTGRTLGIRFEVPNLLSEIYSGETDLYKKMNGLFTILVRVSLSVDVPPEFVVLDIVDASNPSLRLVFTRYVEDVRKSMAEALSYTASQDRLLEEFVVGDKRMTFDPVEMDLVRLMMMAMDAAPEATAPPQPFELEEVRFTDFVAKVAENYMRRALREKKEMKKEVQLRNVSATFGPERGDKRQFKVQLDLVSQPDKRLTASFIESKVLPLMAREAGEVFKSYRFKGVANVTVIEKNSGTMLTVPRP